MATKIYRNYMLQTTILFITDCTVNGTSSGYLHRLFKRSGTLPDFPLGPIILQTNDPAPTLSPDDWEDITSGHTTAQLLNFAAYTMGAQDVVVGVGAIVVGEGVQLPSIAIPSVQYPTTVVLTDGA